MSTTMTVPAGTPTGLDQRVHRPWPALWSLIIGFFMLLVDSTIVSVGTNALMAGLHANLGDVLWVTSGYLLAYAVPLLVTGRLGDRLGPKRVYLAGLALFTLSSFACGLAGSIRVLIAARVVQGLGAALMTPQTMAVITRLFKPADRGKAMSLWGATAGVATLVGPILGGVLIDSLGWEWIFFVNVPVGVVGFVLALRHVPDFPTHGHTFDWLGVALSAVGLFCIVFGIEEGDSYDWGKITGPITVWRLIALGVLVMAAFIWWQARNSREPLVPLRLFRDRNFSVANTAITAMGFAITAQSFPFMIWAQSVLGYSPTRAALLLIPSAVLALVLARPVGHLVNVVHPRLLAGLGLAMFGLGVYLLGHLFGADTAVWKIELAVAAMGLGSAFVWSPLSTSATANLARHEAGAASGVYNTTRQIGSVLGSAAIAVLMQSRINHHLHTTGSTTQTTGTLPAALREPFSRALGESLYLPAGIAVVGALVAFFLVAPAHHALAAGRDEAPAEPGREPEARQPLHADAATHGEQAAPAPASDPVASAAVPEPTRERVVSASPGGRVTPDAVESPALRIHGTVLGANRTPVAGARVTLADQTGHQVARTTAGADGCYAVAPGHGGTYLLIVAADGLAPSASVVGVGDAAVRHDVTLAGTASLSGRVSRSTVDDPAPAPVAGAVVTLTDVTGQVLGSQRTSDDGRYEFTELTAGSYVATVQAAGHRPVAQPVEVAADATACDLVVPAGGQLEGSVLAASDRLPVRHATVTLTDAAGHVAATAVTGDSGAFRFDDLDAGDYVLTAAGYAPVAQPVVVGERAVERATVLLGEAPAAPSDATARTGE